MEHRSANRTARVPAAGSQRTKVRPLTVALVALALVTGCSSSDSSSADGVPWSDYAPTLQARIDGLAAAKDCTGLQTEFDNADANNDATMTRTGHNNADLMGYIDRALRLAGCY